MISTVIIESPLGMLLAGATEEQIADAEAQVERARAAVEQAELGIERAALCAPFNGTVAKVNVSAGEMAPVTSPAVTLLGTDGFRVDITVDEIDVGRLAVGQAAQVTLDALPDVTLDGTVRRIAPAATLAQGGVV